MTNYLLSPSPAENVLVASPSHAVRQRVLDSLRSSVRRCEQTTGGAEALLRLERGSWQVLFLDRSLPDLDAEELGQAVRQRFPDTKVILLDSDFCEDPVPHGTATVGDGRRSGAAKTWRENRVEPAVMLSEAATVAGCNPGTTIPLTRVPERCLETPLPGMVGNSRAMQPVYRLARLLAPRATTVLVTGPTGCGKELVARGIHQLSSRAGRAFAVVNCAAIPETLLEAELFGYARGAFTGAMQAYGGRIQAAQGGTLFLDEIGEMPLNLQPKLLRFLEQKELQRLGSTETVQVDTRVISATNAHLLSLVREGKFREDLYYRLCAFPIEIPPLEKRPEDIELLAVHFLNKYAVRSPVPQLSAQVLTALKAHRWPGNIRELQNVIERALILSENQSFIDREDLWFSDPSCVSP